MCVHRSAEIEDATLSGLKHNRNATPRFIGGVEIEDATLSGLKHVSLRCHSSPVIKWKSKTRLLADLNR